MWNPIVNLYYSDNFFKSKNLLLSGGNSLIKTDNYMFIAKAAKHQYINIYVSNVQSGFLNLKEAKLPGEA